MSYQAANSTEDDAAEVFEMLSADELKLGKAVAQFADSVPEGNKWMRKAFIDWAQYKKTYGIKTTRRDRDGEVPMTELEYVCWATEVKQVPNAEAKSLWASHVDDASIDRDNDGLGGRLQLWIPKVKRTRENIRDKFVQDSTEECSQALKKPKPQELDQLRDFCGSRHTSFADSFLSSPLDAMGVKGTGMKPAGGKSGESIWANYWAGPAQSQAGR